AAWRTSRLRSAGALPSNIAFNSLRVLSEAGTLPKRDAPFRLIDPNAALDVQTESCIPPRISSKFGTSPVELQGAEHDDSLPDEVVAHEGDDAETRRGNPCPEAASPGAHTLGPGSVVDSNECVAYNDCIAFFQGMRCP
ncbi:MAG: hypothetical protein N2653_10275, partial [Burkholderiales bacterium]|nr:hypothetical protein [Burkholderiales bacterium]